LVATNSYWERNGVAKTAIKKLVATIWLITYETEKYGCPLW
jgi:hypothetical protein